MSVTWAKDDSFDCLPYDSGLCVHHRSIYISWNYEDRRAPFVVSAYGAMWNAIKDVFHWNLRYMTGIGSYADVTNFAAVFTTDMDSFSPGAVHRFNSKLSDNQAFCTKY